MQSARKTDADLKVTDRHGYNIFRSWLWEIISIVFAIGLIAAIAALLATHDGKPTPDWGEQINLNALLAVLSTILRAVLVVVVSQIISQRKWDWIAGKRDRPLSDLQQFDSGSRGSLGAMHLLHTVSWRDPLTFTAAIILSASFLVGPSIQQASRTTECLVVDTNTNASLPFAHFVPRRGGYEEFSEGSELGSSWPAPDLAAAILSVITAPGGVENQIRGSCPTGNCTFPHGDPIEVARSNLSASNFTAHATVGICNRCIDNTPLMLNKDDDPCATYSLPNGMSVGHCTTDDTIRVGPNDNLTWLGEALTPELRSISRWAYANISVLAVSAPNRSATAVTCSLYPCVRTYASSIHNNEVSEVFVRSYTMQPDVLTSKETLEVVAGSNTRGNDFSNYTAVQSPCRVGGEIYDLASNGSAFSDSSVLGLYDFTDYGGSEPYRPVTTTISAPEECIYRQHPKFVLAMSALFNNEVFDVSCDADLVKPNCVRGSKSFGQAVTAPFLSGLGPETVAQSLYNYPGYGVVNISKWFDDFSETMTRRLPTDYGAAFGFGFPRPTELPAGQAHGLAWRTTTCVAMRKSWLLLPIVLVFVTVLLAGWTLMTNWRHRHDRPFWKDSILPFIFYGRDVVDRALDEHSFVADELNLRDSVAKTFGNNGRPLDTSEMKEISRSTAVNLPWLHDNDEAPALLKRANWEWNHIKHRKDASDDSLLDTDEGAGTRRDSHGKQSTLPVTDTRERDPALILRQASRDTQTSAGLDTH